MKIKKIEIEHFKHLRDIKIDNIGDYLLIIGDNKAGKSTLLQAIALTVELATGVIKNRSEFHWGNILLEQDRIDTFNINIILELDREEIKNTIELSNKIERKNKINLDQFLNKNSLEIELKFDNSKNKPFIYPKDRMYLLSGRSYLAQLISQDRINSENRLNYYKNIGGVYKFNYNRVYPISLYHKQETNLKSLKVQLRNLWSTHKSEAKNENIPDWINEITEKFKNVFNGFRMLGPVLKSNELVDTDDFYFYVEDGEKNKYDIEEFSSGEETLFKMIWHSVVFSMFKSIILIDEIELHLSEMEQKKLFLNLKKIFPNSQFIITTHSRYFSEQIFSEDDIVVLENGKRIG